MTIEEKAKAYDEALEKSKRLYEQGTITESLAYIFPELKESEDERIRKALIENFKWYCGDFLETTKWGKDDNLLVKDIIAWLEKQDPQILANSAKTCKDEQKPFDYENSYCQENCKGFQETGRCFADGECKAKREAEQKPAWSEEDEEHYNACLNYFEEIKPDSVYYKDYLWLKSLKERIES